MEVGSILAERYLIKAHLEMAIFDNVYLAKDMEQEQTVIVKAIHQQISNDDKALTYLKRNYLLHRDLDHPAIVKMLALEFDQYFSQYFIVEEFIDEINLVTHRLSFSDHKIPLQEAIIIARKIADALDYINKTMMHSNLRPENILLTKDGQIKLINFGMVPEVLAKEMRIRVLRQGQQSPRHLYGYMAPEQFFPPSSQEADRYSFAVILYEIIAGHMPFEQSTFQGLMNAISYYTPPTIPHVGNRCNKALTQAMAKSPTERYSTSMKFVDDLGVAPLSFLPEITQPLAIKVVGGVLITVGLSWYFISDQTGDISQDTSHAMKRTTLAIAPQLPIHKRQATAPTPAFVPTPVPTPTIIPTPVPTPTIIPTPVPTPFNSIPKSQDGRINSVIPQKLTALLEVKTEPEGVNVLLDNEFVGNTPVIVGRVGRGEHKLKLEKAGFYPIEMEINIEADTVIRMSLPKMSTPAAVEQPITKQRDIQTPEEQIYAPKTQTTPFQQPTAKPPPPLSDQKWSQQESDHIIRDLLNRAQLNLDASRLTVPKGRNAVERYQAVLQIDPDNSEAMEGLRYIADKLTQMADDDMEGWRLSSPPGQNALSKLRAAIQLDPSNTNAQIGLKKVVGKYLDMAYKYRHIPNQAEDFINKAQAVIPDDPRILITRSDIFPNAQVNTGTTISVTSPEDSKISAAKIVTLHKEQSQSTTVQLTQQPTIAPEEITSTDSEPPKIEQQPKQIQTPVLTIEDGGDADNSVQTKGTNIVEHYLAILARDPENIAAKKRLQTITPLLLRMADKDISQWRLTSPPGSNALEKLRTILKLQPDNQEATKMVKKIVGRYIRQAYKFRQDPSQAASFLTKAEAILPDDTRIKIARDEIFANTNFDSLPSPTTANQPDGEQPEVESSNYNPATELTPEQKQEQISILLVKAKINFKASRLTVPKGRNAVDRYQAVLALDPNNQMAKKGLLAVAQKLALFAQSDITELRLSSPPGKNAMDKLRTALQLDPNNQTAKDGIVKVVEKYIELAYKFRHDRYQAGNYLTQAEAILPNNHKIAQARADILQQKPNSQFNGSGAIQRGGIDNNGPSDLRNVPDL
ncbi:MAG: protein kinase [Magnetococcales bacterium]|nr:protein kinase [Magnetococcales bacterium]